MIKVAKFGGTSLAGAEEFKLVASVLRDEDIKVTVVSAGGRKGGELKVTDMLCNAYRKIKGGERLFDALKEFYQRVFSLIGELKIGLSIKDLQRQIEGGFEREPTLDFLLSRGEYVYSLILSKYLKRPFVDAKDIMKFSVDGTLNEEMSEFLTRQAFLKTEGFITGGFYGETIDGNIKVLERGGSDYTGAVVAAALNAEYENYTDVDGMYSVDPNLIKNAERISEISYKQARVMSEFGAGVIHPDSVLPLFGKNLCIHIKNTFNPLSDGTVLKEKCEKEVFGCAILKGVVYAKIGKTNCGDELLEKLLKEKLKVIALTSDKDEIDVVFKKTEGDAVKKLGFADKCVVRSDEYLMYFTNCEKSEKIISKLNAEIRADFYCRIDSGNLLVISGEDFNSAIEIIKKSIE